MPADCIVPLKTDLRKAACQGRIAGYILQANQRRTVNTCIGGIAEVVATIPTEPDISDQRRRKYTRESKSEALRAIVVRAERITVGTFRQSWQRRGPNGKRPSPKGFGRWLSG